MHIGNSQSSSKMRSITLDEMVENGVIRKIDEPTDWVNSLAYSRKQNGKLRICLDPKDLNKAIKRCHHHTPTLEEIAHHFAESQHFSKLDAMNGYWSVKLDAQPQLLTTFNSPFGMFCFQCMRFGLVMSQDVFQQLMDQILEKCPGTLGIADDIAVYGKTKTEHDKHLYNLLKAARANGFVFNSERCAIGQEIINFFGMVYDAKGVHPDPERVEDIRNTPTPTNKTCLQQFLGIATYMSPFVPLLAELTAPLRDLMKQDGDYQWNASHQEAFAKIQDEIATQTTLVYFDRNKETTIQVDASSRGLGAVLLQENKPVAFASKSLTETECRYANIERLLLAVVYGCERFHTYIYGSIVVVETDHKPLEMISLKILTSAPSTLQRMLLRIQDYDMTIKYRPGRDMLVADAMSRLPSNQHEPIDLDIKVTFVQSSSDKLSQLQQETKRVGWKPTVTFHNKVTCCDGS